jgi:DNA topoisomerase-1
MPPPPLDYVVDENNEKKICPKCGKPLVHRYTRFGAEFIACSGFPECEYHIFPGHENDKPAIPMEEICPKCGKHLIKR